MARFSENTFENKFSKSVDKKIKQRRIRASLQRVTLNQFEAVLSEKLLRKKLKKSLTLKTNGVKCAPLFERGG